jgi:hypothetical protein
MWIAVLALLAVFLVLGASPHSVAGSERGVKGMVGFHGPWAGGMDIFIDFDVREVNPDTQTATGSVSWKIWHQEMGWRAVDAHATCVQFGEDEGGNPTVVLVSRIVRKTGWGQGEPGEYAYWWLRDSAEGDLHSINYYRPFDPNHPEDFQEFFPRTLAPDCKEFPFFEPPEVMDLGDLAIE